jgi:hypothetical protein
MAASVTHKAKTGPLLTGTEYEATDAHNVSGVALDTHNHDASYEASGAVATHAAAADPHTGYLKESDFAGVDALVGTATGLLSGEIVVGTTPGGELGNTWASPTVDASHSGSTHAATQAAAEATASGALTTHAGAADPHTGYRLESADHTHATTGLQAGQLAQANTHQSPDTDSAAGSLHHTVGAGATQAAAGNHTHASQMTDATTVKKTDGAFTTTSTTFVDVTGLSITITTAAVRCFVIFSATMNNSGSNTVAAVDLDIDGTRVGGDNGIFWQQMQSANDRVPVSFFYMTDVLSAASHTFKIQARASANTTAIQAATTTSSPAIFQVVETSIAS